MDKGKREKLPQTQKNDFDDEIQIGDGFFINTHERQQFNRQRNVTNHTTKKRIRKRPIPGNKFRNSTNQGNRFQNRPPLGNSMQNRLTESTPPRGNKIQNRPTENTPPRGNKIQSRPTPGIISTNSPFNATPGGSRDGQVQHQSNGQIVTASPLAA